MTKKRTPSKTQASGPPVSLLHEIKELIDEARSRAAQAVNVELVRLNWEIGSRIKHEVLKDEKPEYGAQILETLGQCLSQQYGRGFDRSALSRMVRFAELFPDRRIVATLSHKLGWSHFKEILPLENELQRAFYAEMCNLESWSVRTLRDKIRRKLYERTAIAKKPDDVAKQELALIREKGELTPDVVFRDPYLLDFLGLTGAYDEKDIEDAILRELEQFLLELGTGFCFVARQKRITVDFDDYYLDLLFYHRGLRRLVAIDLKLDSFKPEHKGQMEFYLRWLDKFERHPAEEAPIGLILCAGKSDEKIELMSLDSAGIRVAEYITELLPEDVLADKLHLAICNARERLAKKDAALPLIE